MRFGLSGETDIATIAREEQVNDSWISRVVRLHFLAPTIVEAILSETQPIGGYRCDPALSQYPDRVG